MSRTAQVKRDARIGEAEARRDAGIKVRRKLLHWQSHSNVCCLQYLINSKLYFIV